MRAVPPAARHSARRTARWVALAALTALAACRPRVADHPQGPLPSAWGALDQPHLIDVRSGADRIEFTVRWDPVRAPNPEPAVFVFCLPYGVQPKLEWLRTEWDGVSSGRPRPPAGDPASPPMEGVALQPGGILRCWSFATVRFQPSFWAAAGRAAGAAPDAPLRMRWAIRWAGDAADAVAGNAPTPEREPIATVARHLVCNPGDLDRWSIAVPPLHPDLDGKLRDPRAAVPPDAGPWARLRIERDGLYRLDPAALASFGFPTDADGGEGVRLFAEGEAVPVRRIAPGNADGIPPGIYFYGWASRSPYARARTYWVVHAPDAPDPRIGVAGMGAIAPGQLPVLDRIRRRAVVDRDRERLVAYGSFMTIMGVEWTDAKLLDARPIEIPLRLDAPLPESSTTATLPLELTFVTQGPPQVWSGAAAALEYDGQRLAAIDFSQIMDTGRAQADVPRSLLRDGAATLTLRVTRSTSTTLDAQDEWGIWFDRAETTYAARPTLIDGRLVLEAEAVGRPGYYRRAPEPGDGLVLWSFVLDPDARRCEALPPLDDSSSGTLIVAAPGRRTELWDPTAAATPAALAVNWNDAPLHASDPVDYLIVAPRAFHEALEPLIELNRRRGLRSAVVEPETLYDFFGDGMATPWALRNFLAWTAVHWPGGTPPMVLLAGDASSDYLDLMRSGVPNLVPSYTMTTGEEHWASDYWFGVLLGDDDLPDTMISRLSVNNVEDLRAVIEKTVRYASQPLWGPWRATFGYLADNADEEGDQFRRAAERLRIDFTPLAYPFRRIYVDDLPLEDNWYFLTRQIEWLWQNEGVWSKVCGAATDALVETLNAGVAQLDYFGHGSPNVYGEERIWYGGDTPTRDSLRLDSDGRYAVIANFTCNAGAIDFPLTPWNICITEDLMRAPRGGAVAMFIPSGPGRTPLHLQMARMWRRALFEDGVHRLGDVAMLARARLALWGGSRSLLYMYLMLGDPALELQLTPTRFALTVEPQSLRPGVERLHVRLNDIAPAQGRVELWLEDAEGRPLREPLAASYRDGRIDLALDVPPIVPPSRLYVRAYGWNEAAGGDWAAAAIVPVESDAPPPIELTAERLDAAQARLTVRQASGSGATRAGLPLRLDVVRLDGPRREPLESRGGPRGAPFGLPLSIVVAAPKDQRALAFEATLTVERPPVPSPTPTPSREPLALIPSLPELLPADVWVSPARTVARVGLAPDPSWRGFVPECCALERPGAGPWRLRVGGFAGARVDQAMLRLIDAAHPETPFEQRPAARKATNGWFEEAFDLPADLDPTQAGRVQVQFVDPTDETVVAVLDAATLPRRLPRLQIDPATIRHAPDPVTDGQTVFVHVDVKNAGDAPSPPCVARLYDAPPDRGGRPLPVQGMHREAVIPPLGPGRSYPAVLRWDPVRNQGIQTVWVAVLPDPAGADIGPGDERIVSHRFYVRSKSKLVRRAPLRAEPGPGGTVVLICEIANDGETDARNVEVNFYRGEALADETRIGTVVLERVPAQGTAQARLQWRPDPAMQSADPNALIPIRADVRLRGSHERLAE